MGIKNQIRIVPVLVALAVAGCSSAEKAAGVNGTCGLTGTASGTVTGAVTASLNGCAYYGVSTSGSSTITAIGIAGGTAASPTHTVGLGRNGTRPPVGSYTVGAGVTQFSGAFGFKGATSADDRNFILTGGTINVTASSSGSLSATLSSVTASDVSAPSSTVTINGSFTAKCIATSSNTC